MFKTIVWATDRSDSAEIARAVGADVIVVGIRGHTQLAGLLLGSITQRLLHVAPCPVLAIPAG
jgi:nucleotide-binding universal stress UspA family protein